VRHWHIVDYLLCGVEFFGFFLSGSSPSPPVIETAPRFFVVVLSSFGIEEVGTGDTVFDVNP